MRTLTPSSSSAMRQMSSERMRLSVARWMRAPIASGAVSEARIPAATRSTGTRLSSAERSAGKVVAIRPTTSARSRSAASPPSSSSASFARPKALTGAFSTLVSPRLLPVREWPITIDGSSCVTRRPSCDQRPVGLDRGHRLRELVVVVVEVARELTSASSCAIERLRRPWMYEVSIATWATKREPGAACSRLRERERVAGSRARWRGTSSGRGRRRRRSPRSGRRGSAPSAAARARAASIPKSGFSTSPSMKRNFAAALPGMCSRFSSSAPRSRADRTLHDLLRLAVADRLRAHDRHDLLDVRVRRGLGQDLLAHEAGGAGQQHPEPRALAERRELGPRLLLQVQRRAP